MQQVNLSQDWTSADLHLLKFYFRLQNDIELLNPCMCQ